MLHVSFKLKMFLISLLPAIALLYLSVFYTTIRYQDAQDSETFMLSAKIIKVTSQLIHNLQIERGISSGFLAAKDKNPYKNRLIQQRKLTDKSYKEFLEYIRLQTPTIDQINMFTFEQYKKNSKIVLNQLHKFKKIRVLISNSSISFLDEAHFFQESNAKLINIIQTLTTLIKSEKINPIDIYRLELLKESAGRERAYSYNQLLSKHTSSTEIKTIKELIHEQEQLKNEFSNGASISDLILYNEMIDSKLQYNIQKLRVAFFTSDFNKKYSAQWFTLSTQRINEFDDFSKILIDNYLTDMTLRYENAKNSLIITLILWILSVLSFGVSTLIVNRMINKQTMLLNDLQIASYTFDSHEAITITDPNGLVIKVNKAFSDITGYQPNEIIGKSTSILKSHKHSFKFYQNMWQDIIHKGYWSGEIYNKRKNGEIYVEKLSITAIKDSKGDVTNYIAQFLDISELKEAQESATYQASHDFLTGLPNRKSLMDRVHEEFIRAKRHDFLNAFLFIDLDGFKQVNDKFSHTIGDRLLIEVAKRLKEAVREEDYVARMSGDEFSVMLLNLENNEKKAAYDIKLIAQKILKSLNKPFNFDGHTIQISASIGAKIFPDGNKSTYEIINDADTVMYKAKEHGKNQFIFFNKSIESSQKERVQLEQEIQKALKQREFLFYFQPKVDILSHKIIGAELLIRWKHPNRGLLTPEYFLALSKEINLSHQFTTLALESACSFLAQHSHTFEGPLSINISSYELSSKHSVDTIKDIISKYKIQASSIELEILENELIKDFTTTISYIEELRAIGIKFSIDDFGTGYSSISYLQRIPVQTLKIDRNFMHDLEKNNNKELVKTIIQMAQSFNLTTVIEGVETQEQLDFITKCGADQYQGYYFSKAVKKEEFLALL